MTDHLSTFIAAIFKHCTSGGDVCLYVFPHTGPRKAERQEWVGRHDLSAMRSMVEFARGRPSSVFCPPVALYGPALNARGLRTSADANILEAPAIALELDATPAESRALAEAVLGTPTLVIRSGGVTATGEDKLHLYWRLTVPARSQEERDKLKAIRGALAEVFNGDTSGVPLGHPMRWPGSWHTKGEPRLCEIIEQSEAEVDLDQAYDALMLMAPQRSRTTSEVREGFKTPTALDGEELTRLLAKVPNGPHVTWDDWNRIGMTVFDASHGSDDGLAAFHEWSSTDGRYSASETDARWSHWFNSPPKDLSAASLYHAAGEMVPRLTGPEMFGDEDVVLPPQVLPEPVHVTKAKSAGYALRDGRALHHDEQMDHFKGCVYITSLDKVFVPGGELLTRSRFDAVYGGYTFITDNLGEKPPIKSAWDAFTNNQRFAPPTANYLCFRPEEPVGAIIQDGTRTAYNTYVPIETPRSDGDVTPFLDHVARLFPVERDRRILLTYMASLVQNPGVKFQWAPVIVGVQGNGKTLLISVIVHCLGEQYCYLPNTAKMTRNGINFNGWIQGKLFLGMEEVYSANRRDFLEEFKTYVTNLRLPIEGKGQDEYMGDNRANMIFLTNHEDGIPFDPDERRYAAMFTAQREKEDKVRDGMGGDYFPRLWGWLRSGGFAAVNGYLRSYECEAEFDPAQQAVDAPHTSSTERAIRAGRGIIEQEVLSAIDEDRPGFCGGWISSKALETLFKEKNIRLAPNKRPAMLAKLGYGPHPFLVDGRTPGTVLPDGVRCRLYIKDGHISRASTDPCEAYTKAQLKSQTESAEVKLGA